MTTLIAIAKKAAETVGFLAFMAGVCIAIEFAQFWGLV